MVIAIIARQHSLQMALIHHNNVIKAFSSDAVNQLLHKRVLPGASWCSHDSFNAWTFDALLNNIPINAFTVSHRRVNPDQHVVPNENTGGLRTSSKLFTPSSHDNGGMSVDILKLIENAGLNAQEFVTTPVYSGSVSLKANAAFTAGLRIGYDPKNDDPNLEDNPYHGEVWGPHDKPNKFTRRHKRALVEASE